jgi:hypothetical protein
MHCRYGRSKAMKQPNDASLQARLCESSNHWAMAAILWRRLGENKKAETCEHILYNVVCNHNFKLEERKPIILKRADVVFKKSVLP